MRKLPIIGLIFLVFLAGPAFAGGINLAWDYPYDQPDGFRLYARQSGGEYDEPILEIAGDTLTGFVTVPTAGQWYFVCRAYIGNQESANSNEVGAIVEDVSQPINLRLDMQ